MSEFQRLADEILEYYWRTNPVSATFVGIHTYDHELGEYSTEFFVDQAASSRRFIQRLERLDQSQLTPDERIDCRLLRDNCLVTVRSIEDIRYWEKDPAWPIQLALYGIFVLGIRDFAPLEERAAAILSRLRQVPRLLEQGRKTISHPPAIFAETALTVSQGGLAFYQDFVPMIADQVPELKAELLDASRQALAALEEYIKFLKEDLLPGATGTFAVGRGLFDFLLRTNHGLSYDADEIQEIGNGILSETEQLLAQLAEELDPGHKWWEILAEAKRNHPAASELLDAYRREMVRARDFVREQGLVTIPEGETIQVIWTPPFERATIPYAAYMSPAPFEAQQQGLFYVTPVNEQLPPEKQEEQLAGHNWYNITVTALHEAYPGHHLQLIHANKVPSRVRKLLGTSVFIEGWALYCEELMYESGFYADALTRLTQLKDQLWRCCRVLIDVGLHTQGLTVQEAVNLLVKRAQLERVNAEAEVRRYCSTPTQPMSYIIGKYQIMKLRREIADLRGTEFSCREFHDQLLSYGSIPVAIIREAMLKGVQGGQPGL